MKKYATSPTWFEAYTRILKKCLRTEIQNKLEDEQVTFRKNRQTNDNIGRYLKKHIIRNVTKSNNSEVCTKVQIKANKTEIFSQRREQGDSLSPVFFFP